MLVGEPARRPATANPEGTASAFKRRMGRRENIRLRERDYSPEQLSAFLLQKIERDAEAFLGEPVEKAVVTVPAYFDDNQRAATKDACRIAGLEVIRLVNEPTAASLAYGLERLGQELRIVVIDLGGATLGHSEPGGLGQRDHTARHPARRVIALEGKRLARVRKQAAWKPVFAHRRAGAGAPFPRGAGVI